MDQLLCLPTSSSPTLGDTTQSLLAKDALFVFGGQTRVTVDNVGVTNVAAPRAGRKSLTLQVTGVASGSPTIVKVLYGTAVEILTVVDVQTRGLSLVVPHGVHEITRQHAQVEQLYVRAVTDTGSAYVTILDF